MFNHTIIPTYCNIGVLNKENIDSNYLPLQNVHQLAQSL